MKELSPNNKNNLNFEMSANMAIAATVNRQHCPAPGKKPKNTTIEELKKKYESYTMAADEIPLDKSKKSKVKQIASMFDSQISESIDGVNWDIDNSPAAKLQIKPPTRHSTKSNFNKDKAPIPSPRTKSILKAQHNSNKFFVSEDEFAKLTVKHKVELYTQFINEMSKKNPKFVAHVELVEASAKKSEVRGEVVNEKQASVKHLLAKLEASCGFPRQKVSPLASQRIRTAKNGMENFNGIAKLPIKAKEFEDILERPVSHISTLTVKLQPSKTAFYKERSKSLPRYKIENIDDFKATVIVEPSQKRNYEQMRYSLPFEAFAPPKKIRRTRAERLAPKIFFQSQQLKNVFFAWLSEREQKQKAEKGEAELIPNSTIDQHLAETIAKLKNKDNITNKQNEKELTDFKPPEPPEPRPRQRKKKPAPPVPLAAASKATNSQMPTNISGKPQANDESESGLSLLQKITSDESQADNPVVKSDKDFEFAKPSRPARKKKLRRTLTWHNDESFEETTPTTNSTDSDTEIKLPETKHKVLLLQPSTPQSNEKEFSTHPSSEELDSDLLREVNSPRKIKSAYTLTVYSPSPTQEEEEKIKYLKMETFQTWPTGTGYYSSSSQEEKDKIKYLETSQTWSNAIDNSFPPQKEKDKVKYMKRGTAQICSNAIKSPTEQQPSSLNKVSFLDVTDMASNMCDSFIDQGFETGSNDIDSPVRAAKSFTFKKQDTEQYDSLITMTPESISPSNKDIGNSACPLTPLAGQQTIPLKSRRKSIYDESRRSALAMQVIREDQALDQHKIPPRSNNTKEQNLSANASPTPDVPADLAVFRTEQTSQFWIKCAYFSLSFDIFYNDTNRVRLLFNIFSQKSYDTKDLYFGIDNFTFSVSHTYDKEKISKRLPPKNEYSHYWFATGDLVIPFAGKRVSTDKTQQIFEFLKTSAEASGNIRFGVDGVEFSAVREFWNQSPKFSMDSNYSMLVGLQSGNSNGLEGRGKYAWPHTKPVRVSNLDQYNNDEVDSFEENNSSRSSLSPLSDKQFNFIASSPTEQNPKQSTRSSDVFGFGSKNESLDYLFNEEYTTESPQPVTASDRADFNKIKTQQERLSLIQEKLSAYNNPVNFTCDSLNALKGTPHYLQHLKSIVAKIISKGRRDGFNGCTFQQLQSYLFVLSRYADICLHNCNDHVDKVLDALLDHRAVVV